MLRRGGFLRAETNTVDAERRVLACGSEQRCPSEVAWVKDDGERTAWQRAEERRRVCGGEQGGDGKRESAS